MMTNKIFILILVWSMALAAWVTANPPAGTPGTTSGLLTAKNGNIGINIANPTSLLDVGGTLNMNNNKITSLAAPTAGTDAVNKAYADSLSGGSNPAKLWGQGRPGATVINTAGECTVSGVKVSRSARNAGWAESAAVCPAGWWVCSAAERGTGACGSATRQAIGCDTRSVDSFNTTITNELFPQTNDWAWLSNVGVSATNFEYGRYIRAAGGSAGDNEACSIRPVWCCST